MLHNNTPPVNTLFEELLVQQVNVTRACNFDVVVLDVLLQDFVLKVKKFSVPFGYRVLIYHKEYKYNHQGS